MWSWNFRTSRGGETAVRTKETLVAVSISSKRDTVAILLKDGEIKKIIVPPGVEVVHERQRFKIATSVGEWEGMHPAEDDPNDD